MHAYVLKCDTVYVPNLLVFRLFFCLLTIGIFRYWVDQLALWKDKCHHGPYVTLSQH